MEQPSSTRSASLLAGAAALMLAATTLQGCDVPLVEGYLVAGNLDITTHSVAQWRAKPSYWQSNAYLDPETGLATFNSCMDSSLSVLQVCGGHGQCAPFDRDNVDHPVFFCHCDAEWAGVECSTRRRRQSVAWFVSLLFGPLALDELYIGQTQQALQKLLWTVAGCGVGAVHPGIGAGMIGAIWMFDAVRIGAGPVLTDQYRVQADLPRISFAIFTIFFFCTLATAAALASMYYKVVARRRHWDQMLCYTAPKSSAVL